MTTIIILASLALPIMFIWGWTLGHKIGFIDGYAQHADECRVRKCARNK